MSAEIEVVPDPVDDRTPEQIAGRPLVDLTVGELRDLASGFPDIEVTTGMKKPELIVALGGDPDAMNEKDRVQAAAEQAAHEAETAPTENVLELPPDERPDPEDEAPES